jgi:hypothetical protein
MLSLRTHSPTPACFPSRIGSPDAGLLARLA